MNTDPKIPFPHPEAPATGAVSAVDLMSRYYDRYQDLLGGLIPIASRALSHTREETHEALQHLVERALGGSAPRLSGPGAHDDRGRDR